MVNQDYIHEKQEVFGRQAIKWLNPLTWISVLCVIAIGIWTLYDLDK